MEFIINAYVRMLKERGELDELLPKLLVSMGILPISKPQIGPRQYGVDVAAVGKELNSNRNTLFLFTIKFGDIGRKDWDEGTQGIRSSLNEIQDVYMETHIQDEHKHLPIKIVLATSGSLKQEMAQTWAQYTNKYSSRRLSFSLWDADKITQLINDNMLSEELFNGEDRKDISKTLPFIGDPDFIPNDFYSFLKRKLNISGEGEILNKKISLKEATKNMKTVLLVSGIVISWSCDNGNNKVAVEIAEKTLLWMTYSYYNLSFKKSEQVLPLLLQAFSMYLSTVHKLLNKIKPYSQQVHGLSSACHENCLNILNLFELLAHFSCMGISLCELAKRDNTLSKNPIFNEILTCIKNIIINNPGCRTPRMENNISEISITFFFLFLVGDRKFAVNWLNDIVGSLFYSYNLKKYFPVSTDSLYDIAKYELESPDEITFKKLTQSLWIIPTLALWAIVFDNKKAYNDLRNIHSQLVPHSNLQLWFPSSEGLKYNYFCPLFNKLNACGSRDMLELSVEGIRIEDDYNKLLDKLLKYKENEKLNIFASPYYNKLNLYIAIRHFHLPFPSQILIELAKMKLNGNFEEE